MELIDRLGLKPDTFAGRVAVVTGAARGIGEQVARGLAHLGAHVIILDILDEGEKTAERIKGNARNVEFAQVDLRDIDALERFQSEILRTHDGVDILVNNASKMHYEHFQEASIDVWSDLHNTTARASAFLIQKFLPGMLAKADGVICNTMGVDVHSHGAHFAAAMAAQKSMVLSLAGEIGNDTGVSIFGFAPGVVDTPLVRNLASVMPKYRGITLEEYIEKFVRNPGYEGLMPAEHCGASYVYCLANARAYQGQIADAFHPLINHGIIDAAEEEEPPQASDDANSLNWQVHDYVRGVSNMNRSLETRIIERTKELEAANRKLAQQKQQIEDVSSKISRYLPRQVYESIFAGEIDTDIASRRKNLTIFFSDIVEFSHKTERLEPEALSEILNIYFSEMSAIARAHGATIDKFIGDAILMFFGDPESAGQEMDAEACIAMAIDMQRRMTSMHDSFARLGLGEPLEIRIGINSGYCTVGNFGSFDRIDYTVVGSPVNIASRLQDAGEAGQILVTGSTYALLAEKFRFASIGNLELKGIADAVEAYRVVFDPSNEDGAVAISEAQLQALETRLAQVNIDELDEAEKDDLLRTMSKLLKR